MLFRRWQRVSLASGYGVIMFLFWHTEDPGTGNHGGSITTSLIVGLVSTLIVLRVLNRINRW